MFRVSVIGKEREIDDKVLWFSLIDGRVKYKKVLPKKKYKSIFDIIRLSDDFFDTRLTVSKTIDFDEELGEEFKEIIDYIEKDNQITNKNLERWVLDDIHTSLTPKYSISFRTNVKKVDHEAYVYPSKENPVIIFRIIRNHIYDSKENDDATVFERISFYPEKLSRKVNSKQKIEQKEIKKLISEFLDNFHEIFKDF